MGGGEEVWGGITGGREATMKVLTEENFNKMGVGGRFRRTKSLSCTAACPPSGL